MADRRFECQIAKGQIGRYLAGDAFSTEAMQQLEEHIADCNECKAFLNERKASLQSMLGQPRIPARPEPDSPSVPSSSPASVPTPSPTKDQGSGFNLAAMFRFFPSPSAPASKPQASFWKSFGYSIALALVLVTMSFVSRNMGVLTGPKVLAEGKSLPKVAKSASARRVRAVQTGAAAQDLMPTHRPAVERLKPAVTVQTKPSPKLATPSAAHVLAPPLDVPDTPGHPSVEAARRSASHPHHAPIHHQLEITARRQARRLGRRIHRRIRSKPAHHETIRIYEPDGVDLQTEP
jgi:hypothetical protein